MLAPFRRRAGFSLLETLVVLAIIMVLFTLLVPVLTRALRMAKRTAAGEEFRQGQIGAMAMSTADTDRAQSQRTPEQIVGRARQEFHEGPPGEPGDSIIYSTPLYAVTTDLEFRAYWYTLLNPQNTDLPKFTRGGKLIAITPEGLRFELPPIDADVHSPSHPVRWEFISTRLDETSRGDLGGNVFYSDGHLTYIAYPREFPMTQMVAELSHRFYMEVIHH
jgi:type II secretory pathway pseudopilin PulG